MQELLSGLVPGLPERLRDQILARAEGVPLYAVETVRMLLDTGALAEEDGHFQSRTDFSQLAVAETLHALIAARLDANLPEDRALLQDASVIGQSFTADAAAAIAGADAGALTDRLDRLVRRQLLVREVDPRSPERGQYRFVQTLVRDVAYQSLAREDRRARHLAAARYLESLGEDELAGVLANHYLAAFRASRQGPEADALAAQARVSLQAAADRAAALQSHRQVIAYLEQALTVTDAPAERAATTERLVTASEPAGELSRGYDYATQARDLYREVGDGRGALRSVMWAARMLIPLQRADEAVTELEVAIRDAAPLGDTPELAAAYAELARAHMINDVHDRSVEAANQALRIQGASTWSVIEALISKGTSLSVMGNAIEAEATLRGAIHLADRHGLAAAAMRARNNLSGFLSFASLRESVDMDEEGERMGSRFGSRTFRHQFLQNLLEKSWRRGAWDAWVPEVTEALEAESPTLYYQSGFRGQLAIRAAMRGDARDAEAQLRQTLDAVGEMASAQMLAYPALIRGWMRLAEGRLAEAVEELGIASENTNFTMDAGYGALIAAAATGDAGSLDRWVAFYDDPMWPGPVSDALRTVGQALQAIRRGAPGPGDRAVEAAIRALIDGEDLLYGHLAGFLWAELVDESTAARQAGEAAVAFLGESGAAAFVDRFRAAVRRPQPAAGISVHG
jgi:tetratricopeptide (TPR) repeat protein